MSMHQRSIEAANRVEIDKSYTYYPDSIRLQTIKEIGCESRTVLDIAGSSREYSRYLQLSKVTNLNIEDDGNTDIIADLCGAIPIEPEEFDAIICLSILEHVYDPFAAMRNIYRVLKNGGVCFFQTPWIYHYHPKNRKYLNPFNPSLDGIGILFQDFSKVTAYPIRGKYSTMLNLIPMWKKRFDRPSINRFVDTVGGKLFGDDNSPYQASGYFVKAVK